MISEFNSKIIKSLCLLLLVQGCAYFNTFYNAQEHYKDAEKIRIENFGNQLPSRAIQEYEKAIEKSQKVLTDYSDSKYVNDALLLKGKSHFFKREYDSAKEAFDKLKESEEVFFQNETTYWLALCKWKDLRPQPAVNDLKNLLDSTESVDLESRIYLTLGEIYLEIDQPDSAFQFLDRGAKTADSRITREQIYFQIAELSYEKEGCMLYDSENTDVRVKLKGDAYVKVKNMKGNDKNKRYGLLKKILQNTETDYLRRFAEDYDTVKELEQGLKGLIVSILYYYKNVRVNKIKMDIPKHLAPIIYKLHGMYLENVRHVKNSRYKTSFGVVKRFVYSLDTALVYFLLKQEKQVHNKTIETLTSTNTNENTQEDTQEDTQETQDTQEDTQETQED